MITTRLYHDTRAIKDNQPAPLKLSITHKRKVTYFPLGISVTTSQWDKTACKIVNHPNKVFLNNHINKMKIDIDSFLLGKLSEGALVGMDVSNIKNMLLERYAPGNVKPQKNLFAHFLQKFADSKKESTRGVYMQTYRRMLAYCGEELDKLTFEAITKQWLTGFDSFMAQTSKSRNARNIHLRNIRAVFNEAIDEEVTTSYPFRRFKIRPQETAKRSLTTEELRTFFNAKIEPHMEKYRDIFKLTFFLIGINMVDLCSLKTVTKGRIEYYRAKTNRLYSIKVEPEAMEIIKRYRGEGQLLDIMDRYGSHLTYISRFNKNLKLIGDLQVGKQGKKTYVPLFPNLSSYWARHTWASIAAELDIPKETIAAALGHGIGNTTTSIYINFNTKKIDEANRKVIDWVLYNKR